MQFTLFKKDDQDEIMGGEIAPEVQAPKTSKEK